DYYCCSYTTSSTLVF
nr:immunoglobulin light chain junction region [Macaca mulatta]